MIARKVVEEEQAGLGAPGIDELRWLKPVYPGDTLHVRGTIVEKTPSRSKPEIGSFRTKTTVTNQDDVPVLTFTSIVLMRRRPASRTETVTGDWISVAFEFHQAVDREALRRRAARRRRDRAGRR